ncbi:MAG TPA: HAD-IA family hydrolase [Deinococcales bacterium]|nr:HAD-IA family hydrolase [Deinococcales bacterium]
MTPPPLQAVLFDMDGTLLAPLDDGLPAFKARWSIPANQFVVPNLPSLPPLATEEFIALERDVAARAVVRPGIRELLHDLEARGVKVALVTNNSFESVNSVLTAHEIAFPTVRTRADGPIKPAPDLLLSALADMGVQPADAVMVGDTRPDLGAALRAGVRACLLIAEPWNENLVDAGTDATPVRRVSGVPDLRVALEALGGPAGLGAATDLG